MNNRWPADTEDLLELSEPIDEQYEHDMRRFAWIQANSDALYTALDSLVRAVREVLPSIGQSASADAVRKEVESAEALLRSLK